MRRVVLGSAISILIGLVDAFVFQQFGTTFDGALVVAGLAGFGLQNLPGAPNPHG
jgi:hypothetical protein